MKEFAVITIPSHPRYLSVIRSVTATMADIYGMADRAREDVKLAVDEACSNVMKYAYRGDTGRKIVVKFFIRKAFEVVIEDSGIKARPESIEGRSLDDVRPGGLGVHFIRRTFDVFAFDQRKKKGNRLRLIRHRREEDEDRDRGQ
ncbi:MAG: ATP-binding protein [Nitrospirae bacterium]|nr:ATP-binding protein [Nitrospirota bacterium]MCL5421893.1 ATP-binding protein [Nitrospirota bacterium]